MACEILLLDYNVRCFVLFVVVALFRRGELGLNDCG